MPAESPRGGALDRLPKGAIIAIDYYFTIQSIRHKVNPMADTFPDALLGRMAEKFRMLADPTRLAILRALMAGERSVGQVVAATGQGQANASKHLKLLAESGMVRRRKAGLHVYYSVSDPLVGALCDLVCTTLLSEARDRVAEDARLLDTWHGRG